MVVVVVLNGSVSSVVIGMMVRSGVRPGLNRGLRPLQAQQHCSRHRATHHRQHADARPDLLLQLSRQCGDLIGTEAIGTAEQHQISRHQLIAKQIIDVAQVIEAGIGLALRFKGAGIADDAAGSESFTIDHRHHTADTGLRTDLRPAEGLHEGQGQGQATGLNDDAVELISPLEEGLHRGQEFILHRATETTVRQFNDPIVELLFRAEAAAADQIAIDADLTELIHEHRQAEAALEQQAPQQGRLASAKEAGHHGDRQAPQSCGHHLRAPGWSRRRRRRSRSASQRRGGGGRGCSAQPSGAPAQATPAAGRPG